MFAPAFWSTMLVANFAIEQNNVPRDIVCMSTSEIDLKGATDNDLISLASPRVKKNGDTFYFSNGLVSWLNCDSVDFEDLQLLWKDEIELLKDHGLKFGRDMVRVQWFEKEFYTTDDKQVRVECDWVRLVTNGRLAWQNRVSDTIGAVGGDHDSLDHAMLWIDAEKLFQGYHIRRINT